MPAFCVTYDGQYAETINATDAADALALAARYHQDGNKHVIRIFETKTGDETIPYGSRFTFLELVRKMAGRQEIMLLILNEKVGKA